MIFQGKKVEDLTESDFRALLTNKVSEGKQLDYKRDLPGNSDSDRKEFAADVASFANSGGGLILYGIDELRDGNNKPTGLPGAVDGVKVAHVEAVQLQLEQRLRGGIDPVILDLRIIPYKLQNGNHIFGIAIPQSLWAPHMVVVEKTNRFFKRYSGGKDLMTVEEIRDMFLVAADLPERMKNWVTNQSKLIGTEQGLLPIRTPAAIVAMYVIPASSMIGRVNLGVEKLQEHDRNLKPLFVDSPDYRFNLDGRVSFANSVNDVGTVRSYAQLFRTGKIESVATNDVINFNGQQQFMTYRFEEMLRERLSRYLQILQALDLNCPTAVLVTFFNVKNWSFRIPETHPYTFIEHDIDRRIMQKDLIIQPSWINDWNEAKNIDKIVKPIFDNIWNACGWEKSPNFDEKGDWKPR